MKFFTLLMALLIIACSEVSVSDSSSLDQKGDNNELSSGERQAIEEAKKALPEHAKYVDDRGNFDVRACAKDLWETGDYERPPEAVTKARQMETEWIKMVNEKGSRIV